MIEFNCHCSQPISVPDDQAGGLFQCPRCGRLNDVPTLSDLRHIDADGTFKLSELEVVNEPDRLRRATQAFTREHFDASGQEIDLRSSLEDVMRAGVDEVAIPDDDDGLATDPSATPKYDPITGELVVPLKVKPDPARAEESGPIPMATPVLGYAQSHRAPREPGVLGLGLRMLQPQNVFVMFFVLLWHFGLQLAVMPVAAGLFFFAFVPLVMVLMIVGHYGSVVQAMGPGEQDELPRPFGSLEFREDIWEPFVGTVLGAGLAYAPVLLALAFVPPGPERTMAALAGAALGAILFPATLLTAMTSGTMLNLRPDRIVGAIRHCGPAYGLVVVLLLVGPMLYLGGLWGVTYMIFAAFVKGMSNPAIAGSIGTGALLAGIFMTHWGCAALGMLYRAHHAKFPWVLQRHTYRNRTTLPLRRRGMPGVPGSHARPPGAGPARGAKPPAPVRSK